MPSILMRPRFLVSGLLSLGLAAFVLHAAGLADEIEEKFKQYDTNHDGVLSGDELNASPILRKLDLNGDGKVTLDEAREAIKQWREAGESLKEKFREGAPGGSGPGVAQGAKFLENLFKRLDKNGDGKLTPDELTDKSWFEKLDLNHDGIVTLDEARQALAGTAGRRALDRNLPKTASFSEADMAPLKEQPSVLKAGERGVGRRLDDLTLKNLDGQDVPLAATPGDKALVVALFSTTCPISNKLAPEMARLEKDYHGKQVSFRFVNIAPQTKPEEVRKFMSDFGWDSPVLADPAQVAQRALQATASTEVFVLDASRTLVYCGAVNDQYGIGYSKAAPAKNYLREALDAVLRDNAPAIAATSAPGCAIDLVNAPKAAPTALTYNHDVSRILQANCVTCHRENGIAPFPLENYGDVIEHAGMMKKQVTRGAMPPWFAANSGHDEHMWLNDRSLSDKDKADLIAWLNSPDRPQGPAAEAPVRRHFPAGWMMGQPDAVFQIPRPVEVKAEGTMPYQTQIVETNLTEDRWVRGYEIQPTANAVVHHVIVRLVSKTGRTLESGDARDGFFAAYVPGNSYHILPEGFAKKLPAGAKLHVQIHYTPNGHAVQDQVKIGLLYSPQPPQYEVHVSSLAKPSLSIPPGDANHVETAETVIPSNMMFMGLMPHMHFRGKSFKYELITADGKTETLLDVPHYDFNWQIPYSYAQAKFIPAGSTVRITAVYDNSANNPANPDPTKTVRWGEQTYDEMMIGYVEHFTPYAATKMAQK
jgi:Ca2+-binding EF-hand superfamily protein